MRAATLRIHASAIRYFDAVRRAGSIRAAARQLNVASSAVNRQILNLEAEIGTTLFSRLSAGLKLTAAGRSWRATSSRCCATASGRSPSWMR
ncbi:MAG: LysR family transcriptional regulator [Pseudomonadota bacterium]